MKLFNSHLLFGRLVFLVAVLAGFSSAAFAQPSQYPNFGTNGVCFYKDFYYNSSKKCYSLSSNPTQSSASIMQVADMADFRNIASALILTGDAYVEVYSGTNFTGSKSIIMHNTRTMSYLNDDIESFILKRRAGRDFVCFYEHTGYAGTPYCAEGWKWEGNLSGFANRASSVLVSGHVYWELGLSGSSKITGTTSKWYLGDLGANDKGTWIWAEPFGQTTMSGYKPGYLTENTNQYFRFRREQQNRLAAHSSLYTMSQMGTHNSYNFGGYVGGTDPVRNQNVSIAEQYDWGSRVFELDLHSDGNFWHTPDGPAFSVDSYVIFTELSNILKGTSPSDLIAIKIEDLADNQPDVYQSMAYKARTLLGEYIYYSTGGSDCGTVPNRHIKNLRGQNAQNGAILFFAYGCGKGSDYNPMVWKRVGLEPATSTNFGNSSFWGSTTPGSGIALVVEDRRPILTSFKNQLPDFQIIQALKQGVNAVTKDRTWLFQSAGIEEGFLWAWQVPAAYSDSANSSQAWPASQPTQTRADLLFSAKHGTNAAIDQFGFTPWGPAFIGDFRADGYQAQPFCRITPNATGPGSWFIAELPYGSVPVYAWALCQLYAKSKGMPTWQYATFSTPANAYELEQAYQQAKARGYTVMANYIKFEDDWYPDVDQNVFHIQAYSQQTGWVAKCLAPALDPATDGSAVVWKDCDDTAPNQFWLYEQTSGQLFNYGNPAYVLSAGGMTDGNYMRVQLHDKTNAALAWDMNNDQLHMRYSKGLFLSEIGGTQPRVWSDPTNHLPYQLRFPALYRHGLPGINPPPF